MTENEVNAESNGKDNSENLEDPSALESGIIRQVEYYFGDYNLPRDKFLSEQVKLDEGWVPLEVLTTFKRLAKLTTDVEVIAKALNKSSSGLLEISEDNTKIRRSPENPAPEMNEERRKELMARTLYVKGFPKESTLDDLFKFFKEQAQVENLIMRRYLDRNTKQRVFKGSVFATLKTKEEAQSLLDKKDLMYQDTTLLMHWQEDYMQQKQAEYVARKDKKGKKSKDQVEVDSGKGAKEGNEITLPTGTVLHFTEGPDKMTREEIKEALLALEGEVAYVDCKMGDKEGWVRLTKENAAKELIEKTTDGKIKVGEFEVAFKVLEGDEEKVYLDRTVQEMLKRRQYKHKNKRGNWQNKGRQGGGRKRRQEAHNDSPAHKVKALQDPIG